MRTGRPPVAPELRFWKFVERGNDCWLWTGTKCPRGYGSFWHGKGRIKAHRWSYEFHVGPIPQGLQLDHLCRNPSCVRPDHLEPVTARENTLRSSGITASFARATHCVRGHELSIVGARRRCLTCSADARLRHRIRKQEAA